MKNQHSTRSLLLCTAFVLPFGAAALAQNIEINEEQLAGKSEECQALGRQIQAREAPVTTEQVDRVTTAINDDLAQECATLQAQLASAEADGQSIEETASDSQTAEDSETITQQVDVTEQATIEGEAQVTVPDPNVDVAVPAPAVRVTDPQPQVDITQQPIEIDLVQGQPNIAVEIPDIVVRVQIPAPEVYVLRPDPQVQIASQDPQVEVEQGNPTVTVTQAEPELNIDLNVGAEGEPETGGQTLSAEGDGGQVEGLIETAEGNVSTTGDDPQVEIVDAEGRPQMSMQRSEPTLSYQAPEPRVSVLMAQQPTIEVEQSGQPNVTLETEEEREQRRQQQTAQMSGDEAADTQAQADTGAVAPVDQQQAATGGSTMTVGELMGMTVVTADGEDIGAPEAFIEINGQPNVVVSSGGFLGLGATETPVPMSRVSVDGDRLIVEALTEDEIEAADDFEYAEAVELPEESEIEVGGR